MLSTGWKPVSQAGRPPIAGQSMSYFRAAFCAFLLTFCAASQPAPELSPNSPIAIKAGQSIDVTLSGTHLNSIQSITPADSTGLTATLAEPAKDTQLHL